jgi:hypothetical protein
MSSRRWLAALSLIVALAGCVQAATGQAGAPNTPHPRENTGNVPELVFTPDPHSTSLSIKVTAAGPPPSVALTQSIPDSLSSTAQTNRQLTFSPIPNGQTVFGTILWENNGQLGSNGSLDTIKVGNQTAIALGHYQNARYQGDGLGITVWWLPNVQGSPTTIDYISTSGGIWYDGSVASVFSGIPSTATVDAINGTGFAACCSGGVMTSPTVTPTASGDLLYGVGVLYDCGPPTFYVGAGWNASNYVSNCFSKRDEWQVDAATAPIGATFSTSASASVGYAATVAVKIPSSVPTAAQHGGGDGGGGGGGM